MFWSREPKPTIREKGAYSVFPLRQLDSGVYLCDRSSIRIEDENYVRIVVDIPREPHVFEVDALRLYGVEGAPHQVVMPGRPKVLTCHGTDEGRWVTHSRNRLLKRKSVPELVAAIEEEIGELDLLLVCNPGGYDLHSETAVYSKYDGIDGAVQIDMTHDDCFASFDCSQNGATAVIPSTKRDAVFGGSHN